MAKINKATFLRVIEMSQYVVNDSHGAVGVQELTFAIKRIQVRGLALIEFLETNRDNFNAHAMKLIDEAERAIDQSTTRVLKIQETISL